jgi:putative membrane protein
MIKTIIFTIVGNALALLAAAYFVSGFTISNVGNIQAFGGLILVFTAVNLILKPLIRFFLGPLIILTLGLFNLVITAGLLYIIDIYSQNLTITGLSALFASTIKITIVNVIVHSLGKSKD